MSDNKIVETFQCEFENCRHNCNGKCLSRVKYNRCSYRNAKIEATREFALKLISCIHKLEKHSCEIAYKVRKSVYLVDDVHNTIDNLAEEITEGGNEQSSIT